MGTMAPTMDSFSMSSAAKKDMPAVAPRTSAATAARGRDRRARREIGNCVTARRALRFFDRVVDLSKLFERLREVVDFGFERSDGVVAGRGRQRWWW